MSEFSMWPPPGFVRSDFVRQYRGERRLTHILTVRPFCWVVLLPLTGAARFDHQGCPHQGETFGLVSLPIK